MKDLARRLIPILLSGSPLLARSFPLRRRRFGSFNKAENNKKKVPRYMAYIPGSTFLENNLIEGPEENRPFNLVN
jgi:hypothetical protein